MKFLLQELAVAAGGTLHTLRHNDEHVHNAQSNTEQEFSFSFDTRSIQPGQVFIALQGEGSDGHDYLQQALQKGACGLIISDLDRVSQLTHDTSPPHPFIISVDNTLHALHSIARACRQKHPIPAIGITGSNGKTTVKDMAASILNVRYGKRVLKSEKSFNNHIGLPMTLTEMTEQHEIAVLEIGMSAPGEVRHLAGIAKPDFGAVTNIAQAHAGFFHSIEEIMRAKMELIESLPDRGTAILNRDDTLYPNMRSYLREEMRLVTFGLHHTSDISGGMCLADKIPCITAQNILDSDNATYTFDLVTPKGTIPVSLHIPGYHNVQNALAAAAIVCAVYQEEPADILKELKEGLEQFQPSPMRMQMITHHSMTVINDAYNANPSSMKSAMNTLKSFACQGRKIAVLGDMFELGDLSQSAHYTVGQLAAHIPVDRLFLLGEYARDTAKGAMDAGLTASRIVIGESHEHLATELAHQLREGDLVLCKASRGMTLEKVVEHMLKLLS